jgi:biotin transport system substrate-specific component
MNSNMPQALNVSSGAAGAVVTHPLLKNAALVFTGSVLMAVCAHVSFPLFFTPVPVTLQTFGVIFLTLTLGGPRACAALLLYLMEGVCGAPVFSPHGPGAVAQLLGATGGFLMAYPVAALLGGAALRLIRQPGVLQRTMASLCAEFVVFAGGVAWLALFAHRQPASLFAVAVLPFLPGEVLKIAAAVAVSERVKRLL